MKRALQILETFASERQAYQCYVALQEQDGYLGGRILNPSPSKPGWRVQAFMTDDTPTSVECSDCLGVNRACTNCAGTGRVTRDWIREWLPDGMRRVLVPESLARECGWSWEPLPEGA